MKKVKVVYPLKQGLKRGDVVDLPEPAENVKVVYPLKQGLKQFLIYPKSLYS